MPLVLICIMFSSFPGFGLLFGERVGKGGVWLSREVPGGEMLGNKGAVGESIGGERLSVACIGGVLRFGERAGGCVRSVSSGLLTSVCLSVCISCPLYAY